MDPRLGFGMGIMQSFVNARINDMSEEDLITKMTEASDMIRSWIVYDATPTSLPDTSEVRQLPAAASQVGESQ